MLAPFDVPPELEALARSSRRAGAVLAPLFEEHGQRAELAIGDDAFTRLPDRWIHVREGVLRLDVLEKPLRYYQDGDTVRSGGKGAMPVSLRAEFGSSLTCCEAAPLLDAVLGQPGTRDAWYELRELELDLMTGLCAVHAREQVPTGMDLDRRKAGETIIAEGDESSVVYLMLQGRARVFAGRIEVGAIGENEVFGEMGFLTDSPRTATVVAAEECLLQRFAREDFERLVGGRPHLAVDMLRTLARRVVALNRRLNLEPGPDGGV